MHSCCGPCSTAVIERLIEDFDITVFYYNPNITDSEEYEKRKKEQIKFLSNFNESNKEYKVKFLEGEYETEDFFKVTQGLEDENEGGARCTNCFELRLAETLKIALKNGFDAFGTTLTVSPHKNYKLISHIGNGIAEGENIEFLDMDFKKKDGYKRSIELSKEYNLYRQNYCGCEFSKWFLEE